MFKPREYQSDGVTAAFKSMRLGNHPLLAYPTGSGKTIVMASIIKQAIQRWPKTKILVISHVKEILEQNHRSISNHTGFDIGLYSAGLGSRSIKQVTVAGIQSIYRRAREFVHFDLVIIDECHLIPNSGSGMYRKLFKVMGKTKYLGLTATPYRLGDGYIYGKDRLFTDLAIDLTTGEAFAKLIDDGYLSDLKVIQTQLEYDTAKIRTKAGDFSEVDMSDAFDRKGITEAAVNEIIKVGKDYKKWLIFAIDISHAEHIAETLIRSGVPTNVIHSKMEGDRKNVLKEYSKWKYRAIVNVNVLTTGFDEPAIDLVAMLRPTKSPVIHVQTTGRGTRIFEGKDHCAILDFAGNTKRLGPINAIHIKEKGKGVGGEPPTKTCPECDTIHHPSVRVCKWCGHKFQFKHNLSNSTGTDIIAKRNNWKKVDNVTYSVHEKDNRPSTLKVTYQCGLNSYNEWVCLDHSGYAQYKAMHWIKYRGGKAASVGEAMKIKDKLKTPSRILIDNSSKYPLVADYSF